MWSHLFRAGYFLFIPFRQIKDPDPSRSLSRVYQCPLKCQLKSNFKKKYNNNLKCSIKERYEDESQQHLMSNCKLLEYKPNFNASKVSYDNIYSKNRKKQNNVTKLYIELLQIRQEILKSY